MAKLHGVMRSNGASCIGFGVVFVLLPNTVAQFLSATAPAPALLLLILGFGLIGNGLYLFWSARTAIPNKREVVFFSIGDFAWVVFSIVLVSAGIWITNMLAAITTLLVAAVVLLFGVLQVRERRKMCEIER